MEILKITDCDANVGNIVYTYSGLSEVLSGTARKFSAYSSGGRAVLEIAVDNGYGEMLRAEIEDKVADVIAINYKYKYFAKKVHPYGLNEVEQGVLLSALISADVEEDKRYVIKKLEGDEYSVDGVFNFRLTALKNKWAEVVGYVPKTFDGERLKDFIAFLLDEKRGARVFVDKGKVFDKHFRRMTRSFLTGRQYGADKLVNEVLLSGAGEVELLTALPTDVEDFLMEYLGSKIIFGKTYFS